MVAWEADPRTFQIYSTKKKCGMGFGKAVRKQADSRLNQVVFEAEVKRLIRQELEKVMAASSSSPSVKLQLIARLREENKHEEKVG